MGNEFEVLLKIHLYFERKAISESDSSSFVYTATTHKHLKHSQINSG